MNKPSKTLTEAQSNAAMKLATLALTNADGRVSEYEARFAGVNLQKLGVLVARGLFIKTYADFTMPTGPYAGQMVREAYYEAA